MCDYSLRHLTSRPAKAEDLLTVSKFASTISLGFTALEDANMAVCVLPGTELAFSDHITTGNSFLGFGEKIYAHKTARFRQINIEHVHMHHDALELPDGTIVMLQTLKIGQTATILQLPAAPQTEAEAKEQQRVEVVA
jgi:hypothetical protein